MAMNRFKNNISDEFFKAWGVQEISKGLLNTPLNRHFRHSSNLSLTSCSPAELVSVSFDATKIQTIFKKIRKINKKTKKRITFVKNCKVLAGLNQKCKVLAGLNQKKCKVFLGRDIPRNSVSSPRNSA